MLHADDCAGQNKNRSTLFCKVWRAKIGLNNTIPILFMVAGHTKNVVDGAFGLVKQKLETMDARNPAEMTTILASCSDKMDIVSGKAVVS